MATNLVNGKRYIGITSRSMKARRAKHFYSARHASTIYFHKAIRKYGEHSFRFSVLKRCASLQEAGVEEIRLIGLLHPEYNLSKGGPGLTGFKMPASAIEKIRAANIGRQGYWTGKKLPAHVTEMIRERSAEPVAVSKWNASRSLGPQAIAKPVVCLTDGLRYSSAREAGRFYGICPSTITAVCRAKRKTSGGRTFSYEATQ